MSDKITQEIMNKLTDLVTKRYVESRDFNGFCVSDLLDSSFNITENTIRTLILSLLRNDKISLAFSSIQHVNPHIKAFPALSNSEQEKHLSSCPLDQICLYPTPQVLSDFVDVSKYLNLPYTKELMLGVGQLEGRFFKLEVLDRYYKDPRYEVWDDGTSGNISTKNKHIENGSCQKNDQISLDFGCGYSNDENKNRLILAFPIYLHRLTSNHQLHWYSHKLANGLFDSDFMARSYKGEFTENTSIYDALLQQLREINSICKIIGEPPFFKKTFEDGVPDNQYGPLKRATLKEYRSFAVVLRKVILDNANVAFFKKHISIIESGIDKHGKKITKNKSTTRLLREWFNAIKYRPATDEVIPSIIEPLEALHRERCAESHNLYEDEYGNEWHEKHKTLITKIYYSLEGFRLVLSSHPLAKKANYKAPYWIEEMKIKY